MNSVSIYEKRWLDLVFEGKNKSYGAYQLRLQNQRTTILAFFIGMLLLTSTALVPIVINYFSKSGEHTKIICKLTPIVLSNIKPDLPKPPTQAVVPIEEKKVDDIREKKQLIDPTIVKAIDANEIAKNTENQPQPKANPENEAGIAGKNPTPETGGANVTVKTGTEIEKLTSLDKQPQFPGGMGEFTKFIGRKFRTPNIEEEKLLKVYVTFVIEKDGSLSDIKVLRDPGYELGAEAVRVLKSMKTKWEPGMIAGNPVRTAYTLPITVRME
ncbi:MAG TPA: energy transducer TonB [Flavobacterium sp.]|jgi:protein TonB